MKKLIVFSAIDDANEEIYYCCEKSLYLEFGNKVTTNEVVLCGVSQDQEGAVKDYMVNFELSYPEDVKGSEFEVSVCGLGKPSDYMQ